MRLADYALAAGRRVPPGWRYLPDLDEYVTDEGRRVRYAGYGAFVPVKVARKRAKQIARVAANLARRTRT